MWLVLTEDGGSEELQCSAVTFLKFLIIFEQGVLHVYFALSSTDYTASPACSLVLKSGQVGTLTRYCYLLLPIEIAFLFGFLFCFFFFYPSVSST